MNPSGKPNTEHERSIDLEELSLVRSSERCGLPLLLALRSLAGAAVPGLRRRPAARRQLLPGLVALPFFADRLEGRAAAAAGDLEGARAALRLAADGFAALGADWDQACTELSLAQVLAAGGDAEGARENAERALAVFERLGIVRERAQAADLLSR